MLSQVLIPIALCGGAILSNVLQFRLYVRHARIKKSGIKTSAKILSHSYTVEELEGQEYLQTSKTRRITTIQFEVGSKQYTFEKDIGRAADFLSLQQEVPLWYMPQNPEQHVLGKGTTLQSVIANVALSLPFWVMGLWVLLGS